MKRFLALLVILALAVSMPYLLVKVYKDNKELKENGIEVEATITDVKKNGIRATSGSSVTVEYVNENGQTVTAKGIINDGNTEVGRTFKGKYLPDDPETVHLPAKKTLIWLLYGIFGFLTVLSWCMLISVIYRKLTSGSVGKNGIITRAQVLNYDPQTRLITVAFKRADGIDCTAQSVSEVAYNTGAYINIKYMPKGKSAKIVVLGY